MTPMPGEYVAWRRAELHRLPLGRLRQIYAALPGRSEKLAKRSLLTERALVDVIVWTESRGR